MEARPLLGMRRGLGAGVVTVVLLAGAGMSPPAAASTSCAPSGMPGVERCVSGLSAATVSRIYQSQQASNWCWAASVAMILGRYGLAVPQDQVVRTLLGHPGNQRASADAMHQLLTRIWSDGRGLSVRASALPLPPWRRSQGILAPEVLVELGQGKPLLVGVQQHAMVLVQVSFERRTDGRSLGQAGVRLLRAVVLDPASGDGVRSLQPHERDPDFLARVDVEVLKPTPGAPTLIR